MPIFLHLFWLYIASLSSKPFFSVFFSLHLLSRGRLVQKISNLYCKFICVTVHPTNHIWRISNYPYHGSPYKLYLGNQYSTLWSFCKFVEFVWYLICMVFNQWLFLSIFIAHGSTWGHGSYCLLGNIEMKSIYGLVLVSQLTYWVLNARNSKYISLDRHNAFCRVDLQSWFASVGILIIFKYGLAKIL